MNNISANPSFLQAVAELTGIVIRSCVFIVPTLVAIVLIVSLAKGFSSGGGVQVDYSPLVRGFILMVSLYFYEELLGIVSSAIEGFVGMIAQPENIYVELDDLQGGLPSKPEVGDKSLTDYVDQAVEFIQSFDLQAMLQSMVLGGIASLARKVIELLRQTLLGFLYIMGPMAIALSVLPGFGRLFLKWFQNYLSVQFYSLTLVILDNLVVLYTQFTKERVSILSGAPAGVASERIDFLLISIVITILYCMVPYLTSLYIGQTSSGIFQSKAIGLAAAGTALAMKGGAALAGSGGGTALLSGGSAASSALTTAVREGGGGDAPSQPGAHSQTIPIRE
jgi:hypothetical protein